MAGKTSWTRYRVTPSYGGEYTPLTTEDNGIDDDVSPQSSSRRGYVHQAALARKTRWKPKGLERVMLWSGGLCLVATAVVLLMLSFRREDDGAPVVLIHLPEREPGSRVSDDGGSASYAIELDRTSSDSSSGGQVAPPMGADPHNSSGSLHQVILKSGSEESETVGYHAHIDRAATLSRSSSGSRDLDDVGNHGWTNSSVGSLAGSRSSLPRRSRPRRKRDHPTKRPRTGGFRSNGTSLTSHSHSSRSSSGDGLAGSSGSWETDRRDAGQAQVPKSHQDGSHGHSSSRSSDSDVGVIHESSRKNHPISSRSSSGDGLAGSSGSWEIDPGDAGQGQVPKGHRNGSHEHSSSQSSDLDVGDVDGARNESSRDNQGRKPHDDEVSSEWFFEYLQHLLMRLLDELFKAN